MVQFFQTNVGSFGPNGFEAGLGVSDSVEAMSSSNHLEVRILFVFYNLLNVVLIFRK